MKWQRFLWISSICVMTFVSFCFCYLFFVNKFYSLIFPALFLAFLIMFLTQILALKNIKIKNQSVSVNSHDGCDVSKISNILGMQVGFFEVDLKDGTFLCSYNLKDIVPLNIIGDLSNLNVKKVKEIRKYLQKFSVGGDSTLFCIDEDRNNIRWVKVKVKVLNKKIIGLVMDYTNNVLNENEWDKSVLYDRLTGLYNRDAFFIKASRILKKGVNFALFAVCDIDNLKYVNDIHGHSVGDYYMKHMANALKEFEKYGLICRNNDDEFFMFLYRFNSEQEAYRIIDSISKEIRAKGVNMPDGSFIRFGFTLGYSIYPSDSADLNELSNYASFALTMGKGTNRNLNYAFNKEEYNQKSFLVTKNIALDKFIEENLVTYHFQPIVSAKDGSIFGYEALMRPDSSLFSSPMEVLKLAQSEKKLFYIEKQTMVNIINIASNHKDIFKSKKIFINTIPNQILHDSDYEEIKDKLEDLSQSIVYEITENEYCEKGELDRKIKMLRQGNSAIALDDFGSGYNNEANLIDLSPNYVKIDIALIRNINNNKNKMNIVKSIINYNKKNNIKTIAEGIENKEELITVINLGVDFVQGYYISFPQPYFAKSIDPEVVNIIKDCHKQALNA